MNDVLQKPILVTGATGYIGNRLVPELLKKGHRVHAFGRSLDKLRNHPWSGHPDVKLVVGDVLNLPDLVNASKECGAVFYLVDRKSRAAYEMAWRFCPSSPA